MPQANSSRETGFTGKIIIPPQTRCCLHHRRCQSKFPFFAIPSNTILHIRNLIVNLLLEHRQPRYFPKVGWPVDVALPLNEVEPPLTVNVVHHIQAANAAPKGGEVWRHHGVRYERPRI